MRLELHELRPTVRVRNTDSLKQDENLFVFDG